MCILYARSGRIQLSVRAMNITLERKAGIARPVDTICPTYTSDTRVSHADLLWQVYMDVGVVAHATGSAYVEFNHTKVRNSSPAGLVAKACIASSK